MTANKATPTTATFTFTTEERATCEVDYSTSSSTPNLFASDNGVQTLVGQTPVPLYYHVITLNGLVPGQFYYTSLKCTDGSGNVFQSSYNTKNTQSLYGSDIEWGAFEQNWSFTTTCSTPCNISGHVNGFPSATVFLVAYPSGTVTGQYPSYQSYTSVPVDASGNYTFNNVPPLKYGVYAKPTATASTYIVVAPGITGTATCGSAIPCIVNTLALNSSLTGLNFGTPGVSQYYYPWRHP